MKIRPEKVAHLMRREVADIIESRLRDPRLTVTVTVTDVQVTHDLSFARVFVTMMGERDLRPGGMAALKHAAGFIRRELGGRLGLREVPEVRFEYDDSLDHGQRVDLLLKKIERGESLEDEGSE